MIIYINENIRIDTGADLISPENVPTPRLGLPAERIEIGGNWFDVLNTSTLLRKRNYKDGYYRVIYIQINFETGEYYIGKANRRTWSALQRYQGSGLKFSCKYRKHGDKFVRYYIASCKTAEETEQLEASIVDKELLTDEKCLNLVAGGSGTTEHPSAAESAAKMRAYMKNNPEQYRPMLEASKRAFQSGDTPELRARSERIKQVMCVEKYREMSSTRIKKWQKENPEEYAEARRKNRESIRRPETRKKRRASFLKWAKENPEKYLAWQEKALTARTTPEANARRSASLKAWRENNPEQYQARKMKAARAASEKHSKHVCMLDLQSGEVLKTFPSQRAAAKWLVENGKAKNMNCVSSISSVCLRKPCSTGYGYRKKAYGYGWRFLSEMEPEK